MCPHGLFRLHGIQPVRHMLKTTNLASRLLGTIRRLAGSIRGTPTVGTARLGAEPLHRPPRRLLSSFQFRPPLRRFLPPPPQSPRRVAALPALHRPHPCPRVHDASQPGPVARQALAQLPRLPRRLGPHEPLGLGGVGPVPLLRLLPQCLHVLLPPGEGRTEGHLRHGLVVRDGAELLLAVGEEALEAEDAVPELALGVRRGGGGRPRPTDLRGGGGGGGGGMRSRGRHGTNSSVHDSDGLSRSGPRRGRDRRRVGGDGVHVGRVLPPPPGL
mmetsp:Transcript_25025/g.50957  ORF Transcript_25025/g.50957 Transcript_25025/m.50957 type:complete len:272 (-) Transcript_25025:15-830(-)